MSETFYNNVALHRYELRIEEHIVYASSLVSGGLKVF